MQKQLDLFDGITPTANPAKAPRRPNGRKAREERYAEQARQRAAAWARIVPAEKRLSIDDINALLEDAAHQLQTYRS